MKIYLVHAPVEKSNCRASKSRDAKDHLWLRHIFTKKPLVETHFYQKVSFHIHWKDTGHGCQKTTHKWWILWGLLASVFESVENTQYLLQISKGFERSQQPYQPQQPHNDKCQMMNIKCQMSKVEFQISNQRSCEILEDSRSCEILLDIVRYQ